MENQVKFYGRGGEFFGIWIVNILLTIVTLGIYSAWAKVRTKKYFYGNTELGSDRFDYHATPMQILIGRIIAAVCLAIWVIGTEFVPMLAIGLIVILALASPLLIRNNTRFDARVTSYRNVRFDFVGTLKGAYGVFLGWPILAYGVLVLAILLISVVAGSSALAGVIMGVLTFGLGFVIYAWIASQIATYFINGYRYGDRKFSGTVELSAYIKTYLLAGLLGAGLSLIMLIVVGMFIGVSTFTALSSPDLLAQQASVGGIVGMVVTGYASMFLIFFVVMGFVQARIRNYLFSRIVIEGEPEYGFVSRMTAGGLISLMLTNFLMTIVTLGIARPWVMVRNANYVADTTAVTGDLDQLAVEGNEVVGDSAIADEIANAFDLNIGLG
ncbi:YjgN family protein [Photobacterium nomapromontoriensis]|uniref:YjgN family protein n=1 Tax=Photobacterium nomapromontoriensis TaxID=2910237 RepID=UPI003D0A6C33